MSTASTKDNVVIFIHKTPMLLEQPLLGALREAVEARVSEQLRVLAEASAQPVTGDLRELEEHGNALVYTVRQLIALYPARYADDQP